MFAPPLRPNSALYVLSRTLTSAIASRLIADEKRAVPDSSLPFKPSTVTWFHDRRLPPMFGTCEPKLSPIASMSFSYRTPGSSRSSDITSRPLV
jgi:hypothetical protein